MHVSGRTNLSYLQKYFRKVERESEAEKNNLTRQGQLLVSSPGSPSRYRLMFVFSFAPWFARGPT